MLTPKPDKGNLIVSCGVSGKARPVLFVAHLDVVEADPADWSTPPFKLTQKNGVFYGRGVIDIKNEVAILVADTHPPEAREVRAIARHHRGAHLG